MSCRARAIRLILTDGHSCYLDTIQSISGMLQSSYDCCSMRDSNDKRG